MLTSSVKGTKSRLTVSISIVLFLHTFGGCLSNAVVPAAGPSSISHRHPHSATNMSVTIRQM